MKAHYAAFARYNSWANRRLYDAAAELSDTDYRADRGAFFKSMHGTLNHLLTADQPPQFPEQWERWWLQVTHTDTLVVHAGTVAGSVFVETIFGWPGMGRLMVTSIVSRDYPVVLGCAATYAAVVIVANLVAEWLNATLSKEAVSTTCTIQGCAADRTARRSHRALPATPLTLDQVHDRES